MLIDAVHFEQQWNNTMGRAQQQQQSVFLFTTTTTATEQQTADQMV